MTHRTALIIAGSGFAGFLACNIGGIRVAFDAPNDLGGQVLERLQANHGEVKSALTRAGERIGAAETTLGEVKDRLDVFDRRILDAEQKSSRRGGGSPEAEKSPGAMLIESDGYKSLAGTSSQRGRISVEVKTVSTITSAAGSGGALIAPDYRRDAVMLPRRRMTVRNLLAPGQTAGSSVQYPRQTVRNLNAANVPELQMKPQSEIDFELVTVPVHTTAHFVVTSRQILDDAPQLMSLVDSELRYGLDLAEESGFLYGSGVGDEFFGIVPQASPYVAPFSVSMETPIDRLALALTQSELALLPASGIVLNPADWRRILLTKNTQGNYIMGDPLGQTESSIWGIPVIPTLAMLPNHFLVGAFFDGAQIFDRMLAEILVSTEDGSNFRTNQVTVRGERRAAMTVRRPQAFVYGQLVTNS